MKKIRIASISLIVIGILILLYAFGTRYWTIHKQNNIVKNYEQRIKSQKNPSRKFKNNIIPTINHDTIGILIIPKINLKVAIGEGTDMNTLKYAVGHFKGTAMPGQRGNFALAGHRSYTYGQYFNRLNELKIGDKIIVETIKGNYKYKISNIRVVLPSQIDVLNATKYASMTLITCTPIRVGTHRLIVNAILY